MWVPRRDVGGGWETTLSFGVALARAPERHETSDGVLPNGLISLSAFSHKVEIPAHERFWLTWGWQDVAVQCCGAG